MLSSNIWLELWSSHYSLPRWGCQEKETILHKRIMGMFPGLPAVYWFKLNTFLGLVASLPLGCAKYPGILCFPQLFFIFNFYCSFTMLCYFLLCNKMNQSYEYIYSLPFGLPFHLGLDQCGGPLCFCLLFLPETCVPVSSPVEPPVVQVPLAILCKPRA